MIIFVLILKGHSCNIVALCNDLSEFIHEMDN